MSISLFPTQSVGFPDENQSADVKSKPNFIAQYGRAILSHFESSGRDEFFNARERYREQERYAMGKQSISKYKKNKDPLSKILKSNSAKGLDQRPLKVAPKYVNIARGIISRIGYMVSCNPVDQFSINQKKDLEARMRAAMENKAFLDQLGISLEGMEGMEDVPQDNDDLTLKLALRSKPRAAVKLEIAIQNDLDSNDWEQINSEAIYNFLIKGAAIVRDCDYGGKTKLESIRPDDFLCGPSQYPDFRDCKYMGHIVPMTLGEIRRDDKRGELEEEDYEKISQGMNTRGGLVLDKYTRMTEKGKEYDSQTVDVFKFEYKTVNKKVYKSTKTKFGNPILRDRKLGYQMPESEKVDSEVLTEEDTVIYRGSIIIGTDKAYGCGLMNDIKYPKLRDGMPDTSRPLFSYHVYKDKMPCIGEMIPEIVDFIQLNWLKMQNEIARHIPSGHKYDFAAMQNLALTAGGDRISVRELIALHRSEGDFIFSSKNIFNNDDGRASSGIEKLENGMSADVERFWSNVQNGSAQLEALIGFNNASAANDPRSEVGKATTEIAIEGTNNALQYIYAATKYLFKSVTQSCGIRIMDNEEKKDGGDKDLYRRDYQYIIDNRPTQKEWDEMYLEAQRALDMDKIEYEDILEMKMARTINEARAIFVVRTKQRQRLKAAEAAQNQKANYDAQIAAPQAGEKARQETLSLEWSLKMQADAAADERKMAMQEALLQGQERMADKQIQAGIQKQQMGDHVELVKAEMVSETTKEIHEYKEANESKAD